MLHGSLSCLGADLQKRHSQSAPNGHSHNHTTCTQGNEGWSILPMDTTDPDGAEFEPPILQLEEKVHSTSWATFAHLRERLFQSASFSTQTLVLGLKTINWCDRISGSGSECAVSVGVSLIDSNCQLVPRIISFTVMDRVLRHKHQHFPTTLDLTRRCSFLATVLLRFWLNLLAFQVTIATFFLLKVTSDKSIDFSWFYWWLILETGIITPIVLKQFLLPVRSRSCHKGLPTPDSTVGSGSQESNRQEILR